MSSIPSNTDDIRAPLLDTSHVPSHSSSSSSSSSSSASSSLSHSTSSHQFPTSATSTPLTTSTSTSISTSTPISHPVIRSQSATFYDHKDDGIGTGIGSVSTGDIKQVETIQQEENIPYYQRHYERIIQKLKAERELELKKKNEKKVLYTTSQQRWILSVGCLVVSLLITMLVFLFYPRLPTWDIPSMSVVEYRPSVDGSTAFFHISLSASVYNHNFLTMGIESMEIIFFHNTTYLGHTDAGAVRFGSRSSSHLTLDGNFHRLPPEKYGPIGAELAANNGVMSLIMEARVKTNEVFRLTDLQVTCSLLTWINQTESAGPAHIRSCDCSHTVRSRSNHQRRTAAP